MKRLTRQQIDNWTAAEKDDWWLREVYQGSARQLTWRAAITGILIGCVLTLSNFYVGIRTGWTLGVGLTSVLLSFSAFKAFSKLKLGDEITLLENNAMQSVATSAGYMTQPLVAGIPAYILVSGRFPSPTQIYIWIVFVGILGALIAFPLKRKYINDEQLPFPEGLAAAELMTSLHTEAAGEKTRYLLGAAFCSAVLEFFRNPLLDRWKFPLRLPEHFDDLVYRVFTPALWGTPLKDLTVKWDTSLVMVGSGALLPFPTALSMLIGGLINYGLLAPWMIRQGVIHGTGFKNISTWSLWGGAALMTSASLYSFFSKGQILKSAVDFFKRGRAARIADPLAAIELPTRVSLVGVPLITAILGVLALRFFGVEFHVIVIAVVLVFFLSIMAAKATGLTSVTPGGALAKITQIVFSLIVPGNAAAGVLSASLATEVAFSSSNLLMDIKPGYMLGAKPRQQAIGHVIGIVFGSLVAVALFTAILGGDASKMGTDALPFPAALVWKSLSQVLANGISSLHVSMKWLALIGLVSGVVLEIFQQRRWLAVSPVGLGLGFVLPFSDIFSLFLGAFVFFVLTRASSARAKGLASHRESIAAGLIAGGALVGMALIIVANNS